MRYEGTSRTTEWRRRRGFPRRELARSEWQTANPAAFFLKRLAGWKPRLVSAGIWADACQEAELFALGLVDRERNACRRQADRQIYGFLRRYGLRCRRREGKKVWHKEAELSYDTVVSIPQGGMNT